MAEPEAAVADTHLKERFMKQGLVGLGLVSLLIASAALAQKVMPPAEAESQVGKTVTVEFVVKGMGTDSVDYVNGGKQKAYATTDVAEYYAELSEAFFGKNNFFPFTKAQLEKHDPTGFKLMQDTWATK